MHSAVVATAGHVDHGKTALVRALTGMETDRLDAEKRRGLTIDLGFAWTELAGWAVSFIDVPGHERFLDNALTGLSSAPVALFVVAADAGWSRQSSEHRDVLAALGVCHGVVALTRCDVATADQRERAREQAREELTQTGLARAPVIETSAVTGVGLADLRDGLARQIALSAQEPISGPVATSSLPVRLWLDRSFSIPGAGTVVTGTLTGGAIAVGDVLELPGANAAKFTVRGLQSRGENHESIAALDRVAVNLRDISSANIGRGDALLTPNAWDLVTQFDARLVWGDSPRDAVRVHIGTAEVIGHVRRLADDYLRITLKSALPLRPGDRLVLRPDHGRQVSGAAAVLALDPPALTRRGAGADRARELALLQDGSAALIRSRGWISSAELHKTVALPPPDLPDTVRIGDWWISVQQWQMWATNLAALIAREHRRDPLSAGIAEGAAMRELEIPDAQILKGVVQHAGIEHDGGLLRDPRMRAELGPLEKTIKELETRLRRDQFGAPDAADLKELGLGPRELAAAERAGRLLRLREGIVLLPDAPAQAMRILARTPGPFTVSQARQALDTTRRVAVPLLELLDARGWTRRLDESRREVVI